MARKKAAEAEPEELDYNSMVFREITGQFGENVIRNANTFLEDEEYILSISPKLDIGLSGGIPFGSFVVITGPPKYGKSTLALRIGAQAQNYQPLIDIGADVQVYYDDVEGRLKTMNVRGTKGLDTSRFHVIRSTKGNILNAEKHLTAVELALKTHPYSVVIVDSLGALCPENEMISDMEKQERGTINKLLWKFVRRVNNIIPVNKNILICMTQRMKDVSGYGNPDREKGGMGVDYQHDVKIFAKARNYVKSKEDGDPVGQEVTWKIETSALGPPNREAIGFIRYGIGIDETREMIDVACDLGIVSKTKNGWYEYVNQNNEIFKIQGDENAYNMFNSNPAVLEEIFGRVRSLMGWK